MRILHWIFGYFFVYSCCDCVWNEVYLSRWSACWFLLVLFEGQVVATTSTSHTAAPIWLPHRESITIAHIFLRFNSSPASCFQTSWENYDWLTSVTVLIFANFPAAWLFHPPDWEYSGGDTNFRSWVIRCLVGTPYVSSSHGSSSPSDGILPIATGSFSTKHLGFL